VEQLAQRLLEPDVDLGDAVEGALFEQTLLAGLGEAPGRLHHGGVPES